MQDLDNLDINEYLKKVGFGEDEISYILEYATNEIDKNSLHEKIKYLISLGLDPRRIRIVIEEDMTFVTEELSLIIKNGEILKSYLDQDELINSLEVTPELLTVKEGKLEENINLLKLLVNDKEILKVILMDRGEVLTYTPKYLSEKLSYLIENGLKDNIVKILIEEVEALELDNDEIDLDYLKNL